MVKFGRPVVLSVAALYVVVAGLTAAGALNYFMNKLLGNPSTLGSDLQRFIIFVAIISAFMNKKPVLAIMIPIR